jgi:hypothetical protein
MILYKYTSAKIGITILNTTEIRFSQLSSLNDPFESHLPITDLLTDNSIANLLDQILNNEGLLNQVINETVDNMYSKLAPQLPQGVDKAAFQSYLFQQVKIELSSQGKSLNSFLKDQVETKMPDIIAGIRSKLPESVAGEIGALSLTAVPDNEVMWSHYAETHQGLVLGFNADDPFFLNVFEIKYQNERPKLDLAQLSSEHLKTKDRIQKFFGIKNQAWAYEQEYRLVEVIKVLRDTGTEDLRGIRVFVKQFSPSIIQSIILGSRAAQQTYIDIYTLLKQEEFGHIKLYREYIDKDNCRIRIVEM